VLSVIWRYKQLKAMTPAERAKVVPRVVAIGGKAASGASLASLCVACVSSLLDAFCAACVARGRALRLRSQTRENKAVTILQQHPYTQQNHQYNSKQPTTWPSASST
jgi:hypothetical protein